MRYQSPIGGMMVVASDVALVGLWISGQKYYARRMDVEKVVERETKVLRQTTKWLDAYFRGEKPDSHELKVEPEGTDFQRAVWRSLREIPYGETMSYGEIAQKITAKTGGKMSAQAVGGAVGRNPISIIIPCHRVLGTDGKLTGYAGGLELKKYLLELEGISWSG